MFCASRRMRLRYDVIHDDVTVGDNSVRGFFIYSELCLVTHAQANLKRWATRKPPRTNLSIDAHLRVPYAYGTFRVFDLHARLLTQCCCPELFDYKVVKFIQVSFVQVSERTLLEKNATWIKDRAGAITSTIRTRPKTALGLFPKKSPN